MFIRLATLPLITLSASAGGSNPQSNAPLFNAAAIIGNGIVFSVMSLIFKPPRANASLRRYSVKTPKALIAQVFPFKSAVVLTSPLSSRSLRTIMAAAEVPI